MLGSQRRRDNLILLILVALVAITLLLRAWSLNSLPPGLWWDEASQGLDARDLLHGQFRMFFTRAEGKEPLYIYLTTPFVAAWNGQPAAVRLAGAVLGALMVIVLYLAGRALWRQQPSTGAWAGVIAAGLWAISYWPQSINRVGFQVNAFPIVITLAVVMWLNWSHRPDRNRALAFGILAGLALATYLAARFTPLIWLLLYGVLPSARRRALRPTLLWALVGFGVIILPLAAHFALHPGEFTNRASVFPLIRGDYGKEFLEPLISSAKEVAGAFLGWAGDPNYRHNIPGRPAFSPLLAGLFALGAGAAVWSMRRRSDPRGWTLLIWLLVLAVPSVLSLASNPHYPRLFGALPAALLLTAWPLAELASRLARRSTLWRNVAVLGVALVLMTEGARTAHDYFVTWPQIDLYEAFNGDTMLLGERIQATPDAVAVVPIYGDATHVLDYAFPDTPILEVAVDDETIASWLASHLPNAGGQHVLTPIWTIEPQTYADAKLALPFYLQREGQLVGEEHLRNFDLLSYTLGDQPAFDAIGNQVMLDQAFSEDVTLVEARWGAAYPNPDRNSPMTSAGTPFWVVLTWRVDHPLTGLRASVDLVDPAGRRLNHADQQLVRVQPETEDTPLRWAPQTLVRSYHLVDVPAAQLPGPVTLDARLYDSETLEPVLPAGSAATARGSIVLGQAVVGAPAGPSSGAAAPLARTVNAPLPDGLTLLGLDEWPATVQPGSPLTLRLVWQAAQPLAAEQVFVVALDSTHVTATLRLPVDMPVGYPMQTYADLRVSPDVTPGAYELLLNRVGGEEQPVKLGEVEINGRPRRFDVPVLQQPMQATFGDQVALLGIDTTAPVEVAPGQPFTITLAWQAQKTPRQDLVRFVHLLDPEGVLMAQRDGSPCGGECPTSSWLPGEVLVEDVRVQAPVGLAPESYRLAVGWYDAATLQRLAVLDENGQPMADNLLILPTRVEIKPQAPR